MRRMKPIISPFSLAFSVILFTALGLILWRSGTLAFSPGELSSQSEPEGEIQGYSSHSAFEPQCEYCHQPFKSRQADLCVHCHTNIAVQIDAQNEMHGKLKNPVQCSACHPDHRGRDFDLLQNALETFDHSLTSFSLVWHQIDYDSAPMACEDCHILLPDFSVLDQTCSGCHRERDAAFIDHHQQEFGLVCLACHDGIDNMVNFDHDNTAFPLNGKHLQVSCVDCHLDKHFDKTSKDCLSCHAEPQIHLGVFETNCAACHSTEDWQPATLANQNFQHDRNATFSLDRHLQDYQGQPITCQTCHEADLNSLDMQTCISCHATQSAEFMDRHQAQFGSNCLDCHDGFDRLSNFDHADFFPLEGRHADIKCEDCHTNSAGIKVYRHTPAACNQCHAEPEIHAGSFGLQCQYCHTSQQWIPAQLVLHAFPLDHGEEGQVACQTCHTAAYAEYTCYGCHQYEEADITDSHARAGISPAELPKCFQCHQHGTIVQGQ